MKIRTLLSFTIPGLVLLACSSSGGDASGEDPNAVDAQRLLQQQVADAQISLDEAIAIVLAANPGAEVIEVDLDGSGDSLRYEVEIRSGAEVLEVHVDAVTGDIISTTPEDSDADDDDDDAPQVCTGTISLDEAREIAEAEAGGSAVEVESDDCEFEIVVDTAAGLVEVEVSGDGTVQEVEAEDDESGDDGDDGAESDDDDDDDDAESDDD